MRSVMILLLLCFGVFFASSAYVEVGEQTKGCDFSKTHQNTCAVVAFTQDVSRPKDAMSGQATGKTVYSPVLVTMKVNSATPMLFQQMAMGKYMPLASVHYFEPSMDGKEQELFKITLKNVQIAGMKIHYKEGEGLLQDVYLSYGSVQYEYLEKSTTSSDSMIDTSTSGEITLK